MNLDYQLSPKEFSIFLDDQFMPLKQKVWGKLEGILSLLADKELPLIQELGGNLNIDLSVPGPKISKGENYNSYSYRVLDFPRVLEKKDMFLYRAMVLWGHPIGFHLILSGKYQEAFAEKLVLGLHTLPFEVKYAQHDTPWIWEAGADGWLDMTDDQWINPTERQFFKLSSFIPLGAYPRIPERGEQILKAYLEILNEGIY